jgi:hypothetical protein
MEEYYMPSKLWTRPHWELKGQANSALFFRHLPALLPAATTLFVEGDPFPDVENFLRSGAEAGDYLPDRQTDTDECSG